MLRCVGVVVEDGKMESCNCLVNSVEVPSVFMWICLGFKYLDT